MRCPIVFLNTVIFSREPCLQYEHLSGEYGHLQDLNYDLEVEHCTSLQDVNVLENQLSKYQTLLKSSEV